MKAPLKWLKDYVDIDVAPEELGDMMCSAGFEIEDLIYLGKGIENVIAGKIISIEKHPDADRLRVCQVYGGEKVGSFQIVTNAQNVQVGDVVPVALDGASLAGDLKIKKGKIRGVESFGMFCSGKELNVTDADYPGASADLVLVLKEGDAVVGKDIRKVVGTDEYIFDFSVTANRPDCQSIYGIALEVGAVLNKPVRKLDLSYSEVASSSVNDYVDVTVEADDLCRRYMSKALTNVKIERSPEFFRERLRLCGLNSINNIVDLTNFILLEIGQPMHAFDDRELSGNKIIVRRAANDEKIVTLDGKELTLNESNLVICDAEKPVALAGVMGGLNSGIKADTKKVILESAVFKRDCIRKTSKALRIRSDSSSRFEKCVYPVLNEIGLKRLLHFVSEYGWAEIPQGIIDVCFDKPEERTLTFEKRRIDELLGISVPDGICVEMLERLGIKSIISGGAMTCTVPAYREDIESYPDIAEEIIRLYGYDHLVSTTFDKAIVIKGGKNREQKIADTIKTALRYSGAHEIVSYAFVSEKNIEGMNLDGEKKYSDAIKIINPISEDIAVMRTSMLCGMLINIKTNLNRKNDKVRFFEQGRVFIPKELPLKELPVEKECLAIGICGSDEDFFTLKGIIESLASVLNVKLEYKPGGEKYLHPNKSATVIAGGIDIGSFGEIHPTVLENYGIKKKIYYAEFDETLLIKSAYPVTPYKNISKFPAMERDIALVCSKDINAKQLIDCIKSAGGNLLESVNVFDVYEGEKLHSKDDKSVALKLVFVNYERTLEATEVDEKIKKILKSCEFKLGAKLRD